MRKTALIVAALCLLTLRGERAAGFGTGDKGTTGAQFLKLSPGARPSAMGDAFSGVADDVNAVHYNPAGLGFLRRVEVTGSHSALFQGINYEHAAMAVPLLAWIDTQHAKNVYGVAALSVYSLSVDGIERRGLTETDQATETFGSGDFAYALSYGYRIAESGLSVGATAKFIDQKLDATRGTGFAADVGALYRLGQASVGAGIRNAGPGVKLGSTRDPLPTTAFGGIGYKISERFVAAADVTIPRDNSIGLGFGGEYRKEFADKLGAALRAGYNKRNTDAGGGMSGVAFGVGVRYGNFDFDFALVPFGDLGNAYKYSLVVKF